MRLEGWQIVVVVVLAIILFGAPKLPGMARSLGQSMRIFKSEVKQLREEDNVPGTPAGPLPAPAAPEGTVPMTSPVHPESTAHQEKPAPPNGTAHPK